MRPQEVNRIGTSLGHQIAISPGRQIGTYPRWINKMLRGRSRDLGVGRPRDVQGTNICRLGKGKQLSKISFEIQKPFIETSFDLQAFIYMFLRFFSIKI